MSSWRRLVFAAFSSVLVAALGLPALAGEKGAGTEHRNRVSGAKAVGVAGGAMG